jgi:sporulation protein YlmC with PRC-barrel domain
MGKTVVSKSGRKFGVLGDLIFESRTGELIYLSVKSPTAYCLSLDLEKSKEDAHLIPYSAVISSGDFVIVAEDDIM